MGKVFRSFIQGRIVSLFILFFLSTSFAWATSVSQTGIVPQPYHVELKEGYFSISSNTVLYLSEIDPLGKAIQLFNQRFDQAAGFMVDIVDERPENNYIILEPSEGLNSGEECYRLVVSLDGIKIKASSRSGFFYGLMTVLQLLPAEIESPRLVPETDWRVPAVEIIDGPRFKWRGMLLDVGRHFVPVDFIKKQLDIMALFKMNIFHWHLTEDQGWRIEIKKYPKLTRVGATRIEGDGSEHGGYYTQEQIQEIVAYAADRFIQVVPEIEMPGHSFASLVAYPEHSCTGGPFQSRNYWGVVPDVYCAGKEATFRFLEDIIEEVVPLFPSEYFHIGGDECPKDRWEQCRECQERIRREGLKDEHELQSYFVRRIEKILSAHGKKLIGWDEILDGGLAESATVMSWRGEAGGIRAAQQGHDVVMTPQNFVYLDHYQGSSMVEPVSVGKYITLQESYGYDPISIEIGEPYAKHILGTQANVWSEYLYTPEIFEYHIYPRLIAIAEVGWTEPENKDYNDFLKRMDHQYVRLDLHGVKYHIPMPEGPASKIAFLDSVTIGFTSTRPVEKLYTLDGTVPDEFAQVYQSPLTVTDNTTLKIRSVLNNGAMSPVRIISVEKQKLQPSVRIDKTRKGLQGAYANGRFIKVQDLDTVENWVEIEVEDDGSLEKIKNFLHPTGAILAGYLEISQGGIYEFQTNLDQFFVGGELVVNNDGEVKRFSKHNGQVALSKGMHAIQIIYLNNNIGGYPQAWNMFEVEYRNTKDKMFRKLNLSDFYY